jgi:hypothetical protein
MTAIFDELERIVERLRVVKDEADPAALADYGGKGYIRQISLGITEIETGILWLGGTIDTDEGVWPRRTE